MSAKANLGEETVCKACHKTYLTGAEPDPCLGTLPGVIEACCGHGRPEKGYVYLADGTLFRGFRKIEWHDLSRERRKVAQ